MAYKQGNIPEMVESERLMVLAAPDRYPSFYQHAEEAALLFSNFLESIDLDRAVFAMFLSLAKKHLTLALFSIVRLHRVQAMMNLRQVLEAGSLAAFALAHPEHTHFVKTDQRGILVPSQGLTKKRNEWLDKHYSDASKFIKESKHSINSLMSHANLLVAQLAFNMNDENGSFDTAFFDEEDEYHVKSDLWRLGSIAIGLMELLYGANQSLSVIHFVDDFELRVSRLEADSESLREEMTKSERYKQTQELMQQGRPVEPASSSDG
jgi:hypothetical protein